MTPNDETRRDRGTRLSPPPLVIKVQVGVRQTIKNKARENTARERVNKKGACRHEAVTNSENVWGNGKCQNNRYGFGRQYTLPEQLGGTRTVARVRVRVNH